MIFRAVVSLTLSALRRGWAELSVCHRPAFVSPFMSSVTSQNFNLVLDRFKCEAVT